MCLTAVLSACGGASASEPATSASAPEDTSADLDAEAASRGEASEATSSAEPAPAVLRKETIEFPSEDGLTITADLYIGHDKAAPFIVLFHQAGWSRGEYTEIAPRLFAMGFHAMAIDQRSGQASGGVTNETASRARKQKRPDDFLDALPDMRAALRYAAEHYPDAKHIAWGSSYSSALVLYLAGTEPELFDAALSFAPGEYFAKRGKSKHFIRDAAARIAMPVFITSAKDEVPNWDAIYEAIPTHSKQRFVPKTEGNHGSRALYEKFSDSEQYWSAAEAFLRPFLDVHGAPAADVTL